MVKEFPELKSKVLLAPMADITNLAFRIMCKDYGAGLVSTELLSANALAKKNKLVLKLAKTDKKERPVVAQLFSDNIDNFVKSAKILQKDFDIIDLNFGCPAKRITEQGSGSALLKDPKKIGEIVKAVCENVGVPVTVKIRIGTNKKRINAVEVAKICESNGASAVIIHGRTVDQGYSGKVDLEIIKKVKQAVKIPVIGNGNITDGASAKKMLEETGCDYVMIGRASIGNPFILRRLINI
jgi:nifR3 family TIM-barrel protein